MNIFLLKDPGIVYVYNCFVFKSSLLNVFQDGFYAGFFLSHCNNICAQRNKTNIHMENICIACCAKCRLIMKKFNRAKGSRDNKLLITDCVVANHFNIQMISQKQKIKLPCFLWYYFFIGLISGFQSFIVEWWCCIQGYTERRKPY